MFLPFQGKEEKTFKQLMSNKWAMRTWAIKKKISTL